MPEPAPSAAPPLDVLAATFGFDAFRPGQEQVVEALLAGRSALAVFPTGAGKSLCYQLPALLLEGTTIVVSPLIALMKDQLDFLQRAGIDAARLDSSLDAFEQRAVFERLRAGTLKLLYVAPERFDNERFLTQLARARISLFAVDEAHCISEWGHNFRPGYLKLAERARELAAERVLALTATATPAVVADIRAGLGIGEAAAVAPAFSRPTPPLLTTPAPAAERDERLLQRLRERPPGPTIVYVTLQRTSVRVAELLAAAGLPARPYHARIATDQRVAGQWRWTRSGGAVVVAPLAIAMGHGNGRARREAGVVDALRRGGRGGDDRVRHGDRQGGRPLRLPLQPAEEPRVVLAGDRARRPRGRREHLRAPRVPRRRADAGELP